MVGYRPPEDNLEQAVRAQTGSSGSDLCTYSVLQLFRPVHLLSIAVVQTCAHTQNCSGSDLVTYTVLQWFRPVRIRSTAVVQTCAHTQYCSGSDLVT